MNKHVVIGLVFATMMAFAVTALAVEPAASRGEEIYRSVCVRCHGVYGCGDGPALQYFNARPPDFTDPAVFGKRTDAEIVAGLLKRGESSDSAHSPMVLARAMKEDALRDVVRSAARTWACPANTRAGWRGGTSTPPSAGRVMGWTETGRDPLPPTSGSEAARFHFSAVQGRGA